MKYTFRLLVLVVVALTCYVESARYLIVKDNKKSPMITGIPPNPLRARKLPKCPDEKFWVPCTLKKVPNECDEWEIVPGSFPPQKANICHCRKYKPEGKKKSEPRCLSHDA